MTFSHRCVSAAILAVALPTGVVTALTTAAPAVAEGPGLGTPWVASLGDSFISGEAGRWAGNSSVSNSLSDALGPTAYFDNAANTGETTVACHRSKSQESHIGGGVNGLNLACTGAATSTSTEFPGHFKPGLDFADNGAGRQGQAKMLQLFAAAHNVKMVVVAIGGNDFEFPTIVRTCLFDFLGSPFFHKNLCQDDASVMANFTPAHVSEVQAKVATALRNVRAAMRNAGYADTAWSMVVQTYPSVLPDGIGFRYGEIGPTRQTKGGCGVWNKDAEWSNHTALPTINATVRSAIQASGVADVKILELAAAFNGHRLCEKGVGSIEEKGLTSWQQAGAVDQTEWVSRIRTVTALGTSRFIQESLHPNYWAQQGLQSCVRQVWNGGVVRGGTCAVSGTGLVDGEPRMVLR
jgi:hypothetical protein